MPTSDPTTPIPEGWISVAEWMLSVYISGPITADTPEQRDANRKRGYLAAWKLLEYGFAIYCPHTVSVIVAAGQNPSDGDTTLPHNFIMPNDLFWVKTCDIILMLPGYEKSIGCMAELRYAQQLGKQIYYNIEDLLQAELE